MTARRDRDGTFWTPAQDEQLAELLLTETIDVIAARFGRTPGGVAWRARFLGYNIDGAKMRPPQDKHESSASRKQDQEFIDAMMTAILAGKEIAPVGIDERPCTVRPIFVPLRKDIAFSKSSPAASCAGLGD